jgi:hypothetical protein
MLQHLHFDCDVLWYHSLLLLTSIWGELVMRWGSRTRWSFKLRCLLGELHAVRGGVHRA